MTVSIAYNEEYADVERFNDVDEAVVEEIRDIYDFARVDQNSAAIFYLANWDEPIIVSTRNVDVNIVIPWNEPPIATSPQRRSTTQHIVQSVLAANRVDIRHNPDKDKLETSKIGVGYLNGL